MTDDGRKWTVEEASTEPLTVYKFEKLEVYRMASKYTDMIYGLAQALPKTEEHNLKSQIVRAATSIALNIGVPR